MNDLRDIKVCAAGAMETKIYEQGEALIQVRFARVALTPKELKALYEFLKEHYKEQEGTQNHG